MRSVVRNAVVIGAGLTVVGLLIWLAQSPEPLDVVGGEDEGPSAESPAVIQTPSPWRITVLDARGTPIPGCSVLVNGAEHSTDASGVAMITEPPQATAQVAVDHATWGVRNESGVRTDEPLTITYKPRCTLRLNVVTGGSNILEAYLLDETGTHRAISFSGDSLAGFEAELATLPPESMTVVVRTLEGEIQDKIRFERNGQELTLDYGAESFVPAKYLYELEITDHHGTPLSNMQMICTIRYQHPGETVCRLRLNSEGRRPLSLKSPLVEASVILEHPELGTHRVQSVTGTPGTVVRIKWPTPTHRVQLLLADGSPVNNVLVRASGAARWVGSSSEVVLYDNADASLAIPYLRLTSDRRALEWVEIAPTIVEPRSVLELPLGVLLVGLDRRPSPLVRQRRTGTLAVLRANLEDGRFASAKTPSSRFLMEGPSTGQVLLRYGRGVTQIIDAGDLSTTDYVVSLATVRQFARRGDPVTSVYPILDPTNFHLDRPTHGTGRDAESDSDSLSEKTLVENLVQRWSSGEIKLSRPSRGHYWIVTADGGALRVDSSFADGDTVDVPRSRGVFGMVDRSRSHTLLLHGSGESFRCQIAKGVGAFVFPELPTGPLQLELSSAKPPKTVSVESLDEAYDLTE